MGERLQILAGQSHTALAACDVTLVASGTATLEAALFKRPMVIAYHMGRLSWRLMNRKRLQPWVGLPNVLCREFVVPELLQDQATPQALARALLQWLDARRQAPDSIAALEQKFTRLHHALRRDTATIATDAIQKVLQG
jgi:lipid-A-disaccharide synthase